MGTQTVLLILLAGTIALFLALFQYIYRSKHRGKLSMLLAFLRFVTLFSVLLLLINPKVEKTTYYNEKPTLAVVVDNSESIAYLKQDANAKRLVSELKSHTTLNERFDLDLYTFGKNFENSDSLTFDEKQTNPVPVFEQLRQIQGSAATPTLLITDGNQTYGSDYEYLTQRYKQPIFPVILGDTTQYTDVKIQQLNTNRYAYLKNQFPVEIIAVYSGTDAIDTQLKITEGRATLFSQHIHFDRENTSQTINLTLPANNTGVRSYKAEIVPVENEKNKINNVKYFAVEVIDQKTHVAIVSEMTHPDLGALKKAIEANEQRQATILKPNEFIGRSLDFQLAVLYQPNHNFKETYREIQKSGLNSFVIAGTHTNWSALNGLQSYYAQTITNQTEDFQPAVNPNYSAFIIDKLDFSGFPPLVSEFGSLKFSVPFETILFKTVHGTTLDEPLLATMEVAQRREAILLGEGIWRWRAQTYLDTQSFLDFDNFIGKLVQYLSSDQKKSRLNVMHESFYNGNDDVKITAQYVNKNYEFDANATINITVANEETGATRTFPFLLKKSNYEVDLSGLPAGSYTFKVQVSDENLSDSGTFKILDYHVEQQFLNANVDKLKHVAAKSQGTPYFIADTKTLIADLLADERFVTIQKSTKNVVPLIEWEWLLALLALSLSAEWFIRKYNGLI